MRSRSRSSGFGIAVDAQVVENHAGHGGVGMRCFHRPLHLVGEVLHGASLVDGQIAPAGLGLTEQEEIAGAAAPTLVVLSSWTSRVKRAACAAAALQIGVRLWQIRRT